MAALKQQKHLSLSFAIETKCFTLELRLIEINASSIASTVYLAKTKAITHLLAHATVFSGRHFHVTQCKSLEGSITKKK